MAIMQFCSGRVGRKRVFRVATGYVLNSPGRESRWGREFPYSPDRPGANPAYESIPGVKRPGRDADHPPPSSTDVKKSTAIPLLPLWDFVVCSRVNLFTFWSGTNTTASTFLMVTVTWPLKFDRKNSVWKTSLLSNSTTGMVTLRKLDTVKPA